MSDRLVFKPVRLPLERFAFEIADGLPNFCDDRAIRSSMKAHRLDVRTDHGPLACPVLAYCFTPMKYKEEQMRTVSFALSMLASFGLGIGTTQVLKAQPKPPAFVISEIDLTNPDAYAKEYVPLANKALADSGQKRLASGGRTVSLAGAPPAARVVVSMFDSLERAQQAYTSPAYLEARKIGDKYAKLRIFAVEGAPQ